MALRYVVQVDGVVWRTFDSKQDAEDFCKSVAGIVQGVEITEANQDDTVSQRATQ